MLKPLIVLLMLALCRPVFAQNWTNTKNIWKNIEISQSELEKVQVESGRQIFLFRLNNALFLNDLGNAPKRFKGNSIFKNNYKPVIIQYPSSEGERNAIEIVEIQYLLPQLAIKFPSIKSYNGIHLKDHGIIVHFNYFNNGLYTMMINSGKGDLLVDPIKIKGKIFNTVLANQNIINKNDRNYFICSKSISDDKIKNNDLAKSKHCELKAFRPVFLPASEYAKYYRGITESVFSANHFTLPWANGIIEHELSVSHLLVGNNYQIKKYKLIENNSLLNIGNEKLPELIKNSKEEHCLTVAINLAVNKLPINSFQGYSDSLIIQIHDLMKTGFCHKEQMGKESGIQEIPINMSG